MCAQVCWRVKWGCLSLCPPLALMGTLPKNSTHKRPKNFPTQKHMWKQTPRFFAHRCGSIKMFFPSCCLHLQVDTRPATHFNQNLLSRFLPMHQAEHLLYSWGWLINISIAGVASYSLIASIESILAPLRETSCGSHWILLHLSNNKWGVRATLLAIERDPTALSDRKDTIKCAQQQISMDEFNSINAPFHWSTWAGAFSRFSCCSICIC